MKNITDLTVWKQHFGLLPIRLKPLTNELAFVMLNGGYGDFCLQTLANAQDTDYFSSSWSSNTKNYVLIQEDTVNIYNWSRNKNEEIPRRQVEENFDKFYNYLLKRSYKSERDIVPFIIDIFRQFRNITLEKTNPVEALNLLFVLLASLEDGYNVFENEKWSVENVTIPTEFNFFTDKLRNGIGDIRPKLDLVIRHSAGILFQEAQKEVLFFNPQRDLFGGISSKIETKQNLYSSIHYTPPYLARTIVENSIKLLDLTKGKIKIFDPACGSSEFLIEALKQLKEHKFEGRIEIIGWDSSETAINTSRFLLKYEQRTIWENRLDFTARLVNDSLTEAWDNDYDLILMNPPFVSWELLSKNLRSSAREALASSFSGKPNQASAFFLKSIRHLNENGVIGCVIPSSLLTLDAYEKLRKEAMGLFSINLIGKLGNFVFEDALADVSLIIGYKPTSNETPTLLWTRNEKGITQSALRDLRKLNCTNELTVNEKEYSIFHPLSFPIISDSWKTISYKENELLKRMVRFNLEGRLVRVKDIFSVKQGINSGNNRLFKLKKSEFVALPETEKRFFRPAIDNEAIKNGVLSDINYVWYPYNEDGIIIKTEDEFQEKAPFFFEMLSPNKNVLSSRARKSEANWWYLSEHRSWLLKKEPRLVSTRFGNSDSFAIDSKGEFIVENGNAWLPKSGFTDTTTYYFFLAVFSSPFFDNLLSIYSRQLSGGNWFDLGMKYSQEILIPNIHLTEIKETSAYINLVKLGKELEGGNSHVKTVLDDILLKYFYPEI